ncbi:unnamed protein product [Somion occarium]|uniref:protein O-GlcNAc transferase n=1 Tax=Somion occarium TaxID=3059160 RepID=A0ABP1CMR1_9APHY
MAREGLLGSGGPPESNILLTTSGDTRGNFQLHRQSWSIDSITTVSMDHSESVLPQLSSISPTYRPFHIPIHAASDPPSVDAASTTQASNSEMPTSDPSQHNVLPTLPCIAQPQAATTSNSIATSLGRDAILAYAYWLYDTRADVPPGLTHVPLFQQLPHAVVSEDIYKLRLLPLLLTLRSLHPTYIPLLLLLACTYHTLDDYEGSLQMNREILRIDPNYAEAMCNMGTTSRMLGENDQAFEWWWKALRIHPTYWDALDNLIGLVFSLAQTAESSQQRATLHVRAMDICQFVLGEVTDPQGRLKVTLVPNELHRLQRVYFTSASLRVMGTNGVQDAASDYFKAVELVIRPLSPYGEDELYTMRELILSSYVLGLSMCGDPDGTLSEGLNASLNLRGNPSFSILLNDPSFNIFHIIRVAGNALIDALLREGGGALPFLLLSPNQVDRLVVLLFKPSHGILPAICHRVLQSGSLQPSSDDAFQNTNLMTSTILLTLAKRYQDLCPTDVQIPEFPGYVNINHSLCILFYYLAVALVPAPSTYNNLGIMLATVSSTRKYADDTGEHHTLNGPTLAKIYYETGLQIDGTHPHLLTNLGSLYKDQGHVDKAIQLYTKAVSSKPDFDVALANLGNAIQDAGRPWEAIDYYRRAVSVNPDLPEAACGLVSSLTSICDWRGRGGLSTDVAVDNDGNLHLPGNPEDPARPGYITKMVEICESQINMAYMHNIGVVSASTSAEEWVRIAERGYGRSLRQGEHDQWWSLFQQFYQDRDRTGLLVNEGGFLMRFIHWLQPRLQRRWYINLYGKIYDSNQEMGSVDCTASDNYFRPELPKIMLPPAIPSVLPFNTFTYPLSARSVRLIAHRHALRISYAALTQSWLPKHVYPPPSPPFQGKLRIAYLSNDVNNHPLAHLMQSVFGMHNRSHFVVYLYTTSQWDGSTYRPKIAKDVEHFVDASTWSTEAIVNDIIKKRIHILINLGGYTKGARNDVFAVRPCPVQIQLMGYAGTLGTGWCDYLVCDPVACPQEMSAAEQWRRAQRNYAGQFSLDLFGDLDPEAPTENWIYLEKFIYMPFSFMVTDHKQSFRVDEPYSPEQRHQIPPQRLWTDEEIRRAELRQSLFPDLPQDHFIFANFNQEIFAVWLRILVRVPRSILWLLRFPRAGEEHLIRTARQWAGDEVASRVRFSDVVDKEAHIYRGRVADLFLDTTECNAHTIASDVLWSGTPMLTWPRHTYKMCSRVCASMVNATGFGDQMVVNNLQDYEERAVTWANGVEYQSTQKPSGSTFMRPKGDVITLRRNLFLNRDKMPLFDTQRWVRNIEKGYTEVWRRWVAGTQFEMSDEWQECEGIEKESGCIWVPDDDPVDIVRYD